MKRLWKNALVAALLIALDQWSKQWIVQNLALHETRRFLPGLLDLTYTRNFGAAWSSLWGARWLLIIVTAVGMGALLWLLVKIVRHPLGVWALTLVIAGGIGNLIDRVRLGYVVDMLDCAFIDFPVFNAADCCVVIGTILGVIYYCWIYEKEDAKNWEKSDGNNASHGA